MDHTRSPADDKRADKIVLGRLFQEDRCPPGCANRGRRNPTNTRPHGRADTATHRSPPFGAVFQGREQPRCKSSPRQCVGPAVGPRVFRNQRRSPPTRHCAWILARSSKSPSRWRCPLGQCLPSTPF